MAAPPAEIFALVSNPHRHPELDGSGTLRSAPVKGPQQLSQGARFTVAMKQYGVPYKITSKVSAYEQDRVIEWRHPLNHYWRWELAPTADGGTEVTETWRYGMSWLAKGFELNGFPAKNAKGITATLQHLAQRFSR